MKNLSSLTLWVLMLLIGGWRVASAWQPAPATTPASQNTSEESSSVQSNTSAPTIEGTEAAKKAREVLTSARELLFTKSSIHADLTQTVSVGDFKFRSSGKYRSGNGFRYKIEYSVKLAELEGVFLEVSDGQILHTVRTLRPTGSSGASAEDEVEITRRDIQRIKKEIGKHLGNVPAEQSAEIALGGLPAVLASLEKSMVFDSVQQDTLNGQPVITLQAAWNPARRTQLLGGLGNLAAQIEPFFPELVRIAFDAETKFPVRIQYLKLVDPDQQVYLPILTLAFTNVVYDSPVEFLDFSYIPPQGLQVQDDTAAFVEQIRQSAGVTPEGQTPLQQ